MNLSKYITNSWIKIFIGLFFFFVLFSSIYPPQDTDSVRLSAPGNPFLLQWLDYTNTDFDKSIFRHGRFITHVTARVLLQLGEPFTNIGLGILILFVLITAFSHICPQFWENDDPLLKKSFVMLFFLLFLCTASAYVTYFLPVYFASNYLALGLMLLFLLPYHHLLTEQRSTPSMIFIILSGIAAGSSQEQAISLIPMLILLTVILKYKNISIPKWYWVGLASFIVGYIFLYFPDIGNSDRLIKYGNADKWQFMGQTYNWMELGWKRYFYGFIRHMFLGDLKDNSYIFMVFPFLLLFILLWSNNFKKNRNFWDLSNLTPFYYFIFSWAMVSVMAASPKFYYGSIEFGKYFLFIAITQSFYTSLKNNNISQKTQRRIMTILLILILVIPIIQCFIAFPSSLKYRKVRQMFVQAQKEGLKTITIPYVPNNMIKTPFGEILIGTYLLNHEFLKERYELDEIIITNIQENTK